MSRWFVESFDVIRCTYVLSEALHDACARLTHARPAAACKISEKEKVLETRRWSIHGSAWRIDFYDGCVGAQVLFGLRNRRLTYKYITPKTCSKQMVCDGSLMNVCNDLRRARTYKCP